MEDYEEYCEFCNSRLVYFKCVCHEWVEDREKKEKLYIENQKQIKRDAIYNSLAIPKRYTGVDLYKDWNIDKTQLKDYIDNIVSNVLDGLGLALLGSEGTGKTRLSFAVGLYICKKCEIKNIDRIKFYDIFQFAMHEKKEYEKIKKKDVLILDEVGLKQLTDWEMQIAYDLFDYRNEEMLYTIITTNASKEELSSFIGKRSYKRLVESCKFIEFNGKSRRDRG